MLCQGTAGIGSSPAGSCRVQVLSHWLTWQCAFGQHMPLQSKMFKFTQHWTNNPQSSCFSPQLHIAFARPSMAFQLHCLKRQKMASKNRRATHSPTQRYDGKMQSDATVNLVVSPSNHHCKPEALKNRSPISRYSMTPGSKGTLSSDPVDVQILTLTTAAASSPLWFL